MNKLITFKVQDGENEYYDYGIYDDKHTDDEIIKHFYCLDDDDYAMGEREGSYWKDYSILVFIHSNQDIDNDKIQIMKNFGVAYEHTI
jgi:hypothetical protein